MKLKERGIILIPIDFTEQSLLAIKQSYNLARYTHSRIVLLYCYEKRGMERFEEMKELAKQTEKESGLPTDFMTVKGNVYEETNNVAKEIGATLIMVGLESHIEFKDVFKPSAFSMIRKAPCPVITIRGKEQRDGCENILLPLDLSPESREKVDVAIQFAKYYNASIRLLAVFSPEDEGYENQLLAYSHQVKQFIKSKGIPCSNKSIGTDDIPKTVVEYANKIEADLIIVMNKPDLSVKEFFSGTDVQKIVDISNIPVMIVNPMKRESLAHFSSGI
ncbi:MAG TPA: universal stress protein [Bacteroidia bacterium]|nr:universal stress protein [Bacteroidia bacterium]